MDIGTDKQLFIDQRFFESSEGIKLCMNPPVQHPDPVLIMDKPWEENGIGAYSTAFREPDGQFRLWYDALMSTGLPHEGARRLCYAESPDGIHWEKKPLGLVPFRGSTQNNIVAPHHERQSMQGATVFRDERAPSDERYKLWSKFRPTDEELAGGARGGLWAMHSADGIHWQPYPDQPNPSNQSCDTQNMFFWDDSLQLYVGYTRVRETQSTEEAAAAGRLAYRSIGRITSPDFRTWSSTQIVLEADATDLAVLVPSKSDELRPSIDYYTSCAMKYEGAQDVYLMFPSVHYHWGENNFPATMDTQLMSSRDGINWHRQGDRGPFLRHGLEGGLRGGMLFANPWLVPVDDELWLYYAGMPYNHAIKPKDVQRSSCLFRSTMRVDGFVSVDAGFGGGQFTTPLLQFDGNHLELNLDGSAGGWLQVEIQDATGQPLPGFCLSDADAVLGNAISKTVTWNGESDVSELAGQSIRLRFVLRDMKLYAFQFSA
jgi:hypothetical protein